MRKILCLHENYNAVNTYRLHRFLDNIPNKVVKQGYLNKKRRKIGDIAKMLKKKGDIWICKYLPNNPDKKANFISTLISAKRISGAKLIVDIDDNIWDIPLGNPVFWHYRENNNLGAMSYLVQEADWVTCSTAPLKNVLEKYNRKVKIFKNVIDQKDWKLGNKKKNKKVRIGWIFSITHVADMRAVSEALTEIMEEFKDEVEFVLMGGDKGLFEFDYKYTKTVKHEEYIKKLEGLNLDISICPLIDHKFNHSKSNIKWIESSLAGAAVVASKVYPYEHSIKDRKTGFICGNKKQWKNALRKLIKSEELRNELVKNAREEILKDYTIESIKDDYHNFLECL